MLSHVICERNKWDTDCQMPCVYRWLDILRLKETRMSRFSTHGHGPQGSRWRHRLLYFMSLLLLLGSLIGVAGCDSGPASGDRHGDVMMVVRGAAVPGTTIEVVLEIGGRSATAIAASDGTATLEILDLSPGEKQPYRMTWRVPEISCVSDNPISLILATLAGQVDVIKGQITLIKPRQSAMDITHNTDGDAFTNLDEIRASSDPCDLRSLPPINFLDFDTTEALQLNGMVDIFNNRLRLTSALAGQTGSAWYTKSQQYIEEGFETTFRFQLTDIGGGPHPDDMNFGADGFAFVIQVDSETALGQDGGGLGYQGIPNSLAVEFDTWWNNGRGGGIDRHEPNDNHVSVNTRGEDGNSPDHDASRGSTVDIPDISDESIHTINITYTPGRMTIFFDDLDTPVLVVPVNLNTILRLSNGHAWVGFTASTGGGFENHDILSWQFRGSR